MSKSIYNPYCLYTGGKFNKMNRIATKAITEAIQNGEITLKNVWNNPILNAHRHVGASDTETREIIHTLLTTGKMAAKPRLSFEEKDQIGKLTNGIMNGFMWDQITRLHLKHIKPNTMKSIIEDTVGPMIKSESYFDDDDRKVFRKHKEAIHKEVYRRITQG